MERDDKVYVHNIVDAIDSINEFVKGIGSADKFLKPENKKTQSAVIREFEVIGEAARQLTDHFREIKSDLPWSRIIGMRNKLAHEYWDIDLKLIWKTITDHLGPLRKALQDYLAAQIVEGKK